MDEDERVGRFCLLCHGSGPWDKYGVSLSRWCAQLCSRLTDIGAIHSIGAPIHVYPLFENGFRAYRGQSIADNHDESAQMYAEFAKVAEQQPYAWNYGKKASTKQDVGTVTKRNRMICFPCMVLPAPQNYSTHPTTSSSY